MLTPIKEPTITDLLTPALEECDITMGQYKKHNEEVTRVLAREGFIVNERGIEQDIADEGRRWGHCIKTILNFKPENQIILFSDELFPNYNYQKLSKKGNLMHAPRRSKEPVLDNLLEKMKYVQTRDLYVGMDSQGKHKTTQEYRVMLLYDIFRADRMLRRLRDDGIELKFKIYPGDPMTRGVKAAVYSVPSFSKRRVYTVTMSHIGVYKNPKDREKAIRNSYDLKDKHGKCGKSNWYVFKDYRGNEESIFAHEREGDELIFDQHSILAFKYLIPHLRAEGFKVIDPVINTNKIRFGDKLFDRLPYVFTEKRDKKGRIRREHLNNVQREIICWKLLGYNNYCWEQEILKGRKRR